MMFGILSGFLLLVIFFIIAGILYKPYTKQLFFEDGGEYLTITKMIVIECPSLKFDERFISIRASYINKFVLYLLFLIFSCLLNNLVFTYVLTSIHALILLFTIWVFSRRKKDFKEFLLYDSKNEGNHVDKDNITKQYKKSIKPAMNAFLTLPIYQFLLHIALLFSVTLFS